MPGTFRFYPTTTARPVLGGHLVTATALNYSATAMPFQDASLGGYIAGMPLPYERFVPNFYGYEGDTFEAPPLDSARPSVSLHQMFANATAAERTAGSIKYRAFMLKNILTSAVANVTTATTPNIWFEFQPRSGIGTIALAVDTVGVDGGSRPSGRIQSVATEDTAPSGLSFSSPTSGAPLALSTIAGGGFRPLWFRRTLGAGVAAYPWDVFAIAIQPSGEAAQHFYFYYSLLQETISTANTTFVGARDGKTITSPEGEVYTLTTKNAAGTAIDMPENAVWLTATGTLYSPRYTPEVMLGDLPTGLTRTMTFHQPYIRTGTGTYRIHFRPPHPGHWHLVTDIAAEARIERSVVVSPIGDRT